MNRVLDIEGGFPLFLAFFLASFVFLSLVFMPLLVIPFAQHDDYNFFAVVPKEEVLSHPQTLFMFYFGRPFQGIYGELVKPFIDVPADLAPFRMISILFASVSAALFALQLRATGIGKLPLLFAIIAIFLLPGVQFYIILVYASPMIMAVSFALLSAMLLEKVEARDFLRLRFTKFRPFLFAIGSFLLLLLSIHTYQTSTMFFFVPTLVLILFTDINKWKETRLLVLRNLVLFSAVVLTFFLVHRYITLPFLLDRFPQAAHVVTQGSLYEFSVSTDILNKLSFFIKSLSFQSLNLWSIYPAKKVAFFVLLFIAAGALAALWKLGRTTALRGRYWSVSQASVAVALLLILSNLPNLAAAGGYPAYRTLFPYMAMIVILLLWSAKSVSDILPQKWQSRAIWIVTGLLMIIGIFSAHYNILNVAVNNHLELSYLRAAVAAEIANKPPAIHVIRSSGIRADRSYLNLPARHDEFNMYTFAYPLMLQTFLKVEGEDRDGIIRTDYLPTINVSWADEKVLYMPSGSTIVILDALMFPLKGSQVKPTNKYEIVYIDVSAAGRPYYSGGALAFDGIIGGGSYWQAGNGYPQWLRITYPDPKKVLSYELQTGELPERMIKAWTLQGSEDGNKWTDIDSRTGQTNWKANEKRVYEVDKPANYKYYRFFITDGNAPVLRVYEIKMIFQ